MIAVPNEASAFLGAVGAFLVLLAVFYLYLNKKFCFTKIGGFPCCDNPPKKEASFKELGSAFSYDEVDSSTDSEDEVLQRFQQSNSFYGGLRKAGGSLEEPIMDSPLFTKSEAGLSSSADPISQVEKGHSTSYSETDGTQPLLEAVQQFDNSAYDDVLSESAKTSACGDSLVEQEVPTEKLFDFEMHQSPQVSRCGSLEVSFAYDAAARKMSVTIHKAQDLPSRERGGPNNVQVRLLLLPHKRQKHKTKIRDGTKLHFNEHFVFSRISSEELNVMGLRLRLYGCERMRREQLIGEALVPFASINFTQQTTLWLTLEPRAHLASSDSKSDLCSLARSDSTGSTQSMQHGGLPELLLGLSYNGTTGRLSVEVIKGSHFHNVSMLKAPDTYVKLSLVSSSGQEIARSKTSVRRGQPNPLFKETFVFQVALFQLPDVTLMVSVYNKRSMKRKEMIGWFSLGLNSSGEEELSHWNDMRENKGEQVCHWHVLLET